MSAEGTTAILFRLCLLHSVLAKEDAFLSECHLLSVSASISWARGLKLMTSEQLLVAAMSQSWRAHAHKNSSLPEPEDSTCYYTLSVFLTTT